MFLEMITLFGLTLTCLGAAIAAQAVILSADEALNVGYSRFASGDREEDLKLPMVQNLLRSSRNARRGLQCIAGGTIFQMIPVIVTGAHKLQQSFA